ncbi:hypothetical protein HH297_11380, partial [Xanthomonas sp. Kuri4-3]
MRLCLRAALCCVLTLSTAQAGVPLTPAGNGHLVVPTFVDGKGTLPFILDTGADGTGIYDWFARQQALRPGPVRELGGMTGTTSTPTYRLRSVGIDGRFLHDLVVDSYPDRHDQEIAAGVVGNDLMDGSVAVFDFPCAQLSLLPKPVDLRRLLTRAAQRFEGGAVAQGTQLTFPVRIGEAEGIAVLDTGSFRVDGYFEETRLRGVHPGQAVDIHLMGEPQVLHGHVQSIAAGIEDRYRSDGSSLLPNVTPAFDWVRLAQRIPVRIALDAVPPQVRLIAGRTATVSILPDSARP